MKVKIILFCFSFFLISGIGFAQKNKEAKSIISEKTSIKKYHNKGELERMHKGKLLDLYKERIEVIVRILPYIGFATKPGITMSDLGIPDNNDNKKSLENEFEATDTYLEANGEFQKKMLPYTDTSKLIAAILFYEEMMKFLHEYSEFN
jgi:hypothetical protein